MYGLPPNTLINKPLYKKAVFEKFNLKAVERDRFDADISRMALVARVSSATVPALTKGKEIEGFYVLQVALKRKDYDSKNILMLQKLIPQKLIFALQFEEQTQFCIFYTRLQQSAWMPNDEATITLQGLSLDDVWDNIVATIGNLDIEAEESIEEQIINREQHEKLLRQIEALEKRCRAEKQTRKRYELHQQIIKLKEELK
jgi:Mg2+ and Co2+ transporter CorA